MADGFANTNEATSLESAGVGSPLADTRMEPLGQWAALANGLHTSSIGLALVDTRKHVVRANEAFEAMIDVAVRDTHTTLTARVAQRSPSAAKTLEAILDRAEAASLSLEGPQGRQVTLHVAALDGGTRLVVAEDNARHARADESAAQPIQCDPLTGLGNRETLEAAIRQRAPGHAEDVTLAVIMIDLDRFKQVNDTLGHATGDTLLKLVAKRLRSVTREGDTVIRLGGDEFAILHTTGLQPDGANSVGRRVVDLMSRPFLVDGHQVNIGASVGIAVSQAATDKPAELLKRADLALYEAKGLGRGTFRLFEPHMERQALERRALEVSLRRALGLKELALYYQPQVNLSDRVVTGFEALIRWHNPERGMVSPGDFIPLAEEIGEIHAIGEWTIREACKEAATWPGELAVAVNVSPLQFDKGDIVEMVRKALAFSGLAPQRLELEITESVLMTDTDAVLRSLRALRELGVGVAMDDFGTGYSSLSYLNSFPFSKLKIDQSFIRSRQTEKTQALIDAILSLGASLGMTTIAEGVETETQYKALAGSGCQSAQGYLISRPMPQDRIQSYLAGCRYR